MGSPTRHAEKRIPALNSGSRRLNRQRTPLGGVPFKIERALSDAAVSKVLVSGHSVCS